MSNSGLAVKYPLDAVTLGKFADLLGKSPRAVEEMVKGNKLPIVKFSDPEKPGARQEKLVSIEAFNNGVRKAFYSQPKEQRDAWLMWLGL